MPRPGLPTPRRTLVTLVGVLLVALPACSWRKTAFELGLGSFATDLTVVRSVARGPYRDATLTGHGLTLEVFAPDDEDCRFVLTPDAQADYVERGVGGRFEREGRSCVALGGGLGLVGSRQPRSTDLRGSPVPRSQATFGVLYADEELMLLRGRFLEAARVGWPRADDTVVAVPTSVTCRTAIQGGTASMEYRPAGRNTLSLVGRDGLCPIVGLMRPPDQAGAPDTDTDAG